jgi:hypothetical protein
VCRQVRQARFAKPPAATGAIGSEALIGWTRMTFGMHGNQDPKMPRDAAADNAVVHRRERFAAAEVRKWRCIK